MRHTTHFINAKIVVFSIVWQYYNIFLYFCTANYDLNQYIKYIIRIELIELEIKIISHKQWQKN